MTGVAEYTFARTLPGPLFKFRTFDASKDADSQYQGYAASLIRDSLIYVPSPWDLNDPWEGRPAFAVPEPTPERPLPDDFIAGLADSVAPELKEKMTKWAESHDFEAACRLMQDAHHSGSRELGVYSLSSEVNHPLQWSYYANGHRGFAWIFSQKVAPLCGAIRVYYEKECPSIDWTRWRELDLIKAALLTKANHWLHEQEYRFLLPRNPPADRYNVVPHNGVGGVPNGRYLKLPSDALLGVVFGAGMKADHAAALVKCASDAGRSLEFYKAGIHRKKFEMAIMRLTAEDEADLLKKATAFSRDRTRK